SAAIFEIILGNPLKLRLARSVEVVAYGIVGKTERFHLRLERDGKALHRREGGFRTVNGRISAGCEQQNCANRAAPGDSSRIKHQNLFPIAQHSRAHFWECPTVL